MLKNNKGITGIDSVIALVAIMIFSSTVFALMYNVRNENLKMSYKLLSNIYLVETLENIGIEKYENINNDNLEVFPNKMSDKFEKSIEVNNFKDKEEDIIKKVKVSIKYKIGDKTYEETAERLKIKE